jgi:cytidylate kinase
MLLWINGTFGVGKTTTARAIRENAPHWRLFDPEWVGYLLREHLRDLPVDDFQDISSWRRLVPTVAAAIRSEAPTPHLLAVQAVLRPDYWAEIRAGLDAEGFDVFHVLLDAGESELRARIAADEVELGAEQWRLDHVDRYLAARSVISATADLVVDTTHIDAQEAATRILQALPLS